MKRDGAEMRGMKIEVVLGIAIVALLGVGVWQQQQVIDELAALRTSGGVRTASGGNVPAVQAPKAPSALAPVSLDFDIKNAAIRGQSMGDVVFLEFSDFQCPFCKRYIDEVYPRLAADYVDTGKIRYAFRHFPLESLHPNAMNSALAASCAQREGKFWQMHDRLFGKQQALDLPALLTYGAAVGANDGTYRACLTSKATLPQVQADGDVALRSELTGTPGFFVGRVGADGKLHATRRVIGAQAYSVFQSAIDDVLASKK